MAELETARTNHTLAETVLGEPNVISRVEPDKKKPQNFPDEPISAALEESFRTESNLPSFAKPDPIEM